MVIDDRNSGNPVAGCNATVARYVVLPSGEVPHEIPPIHIIDLVIKEELNILPQRGHLVHIGHAAPPFIPDTMVSE
jgi:hypothetical protein